MRGTPLPLISDSKGLIKSIFDSKGLTPFIFDSKGLNKSKSHWSLTRTVASLFKSLAGVSRNCVWESGSGAGLERLKYLSGEWKREQRDRQEQPLLRDDEVKARSKAIRAGVYGARRDPSSLRSVGMTSINKIKSKSTARAKARARQRVLRSQFQKVGGLNLILMSSILISR